MVILKKLGEVAVDSGQVMVVDPCYLHDWKDGEFDPDAKVEPENSYDKVCRVTLSDEQGGEICVAGVGGTGVATSSGYGDGCYHAYVLRSDRTGGWGRRHLALVILFDESAATIADLVDQLQELPVGETDEVREDMDEE